MGYMYNVTWKFCLWWWFAYDLEKCTKFRYPTFFFANSDFALVLVQFNTSLRQFLCDDFTPWMSMNQIIVIVLYILFEQRNVKVNYSRNNRLLEWRKWCLCPFWILLQICWYSHLFNLWYFLIISFGYLLSRLCLISS